MENNNFNGQQPYQQPQYQQPYQQAQSQYQYQYQQPMPQYQQNDPAYMAKASEFLKTAIIACAIGSLPVGSIIAINMGTKNWKAVLDYIATGGLHTPRIKLCSCLSRVARYTGIGFTIFWGVWLLYFAISMIGIIGTILANIN